MANTPQIKVYNLGFFNEQKDLWFTNDMVAFHDFCSRYSNIEIESTVFHYDEEKSVKFEEIERKFSEINKLETDEESWIFVFLHGHGFETNADFKIFAAIDSQQKKQYITSKYIRKVLNLALNKYSFFIIINSCDAKLIKAYRDYELRAKSTFNTLFMSSTYSNDSDSDKKLKKPKLNKVQIKASKNIKLLYLLSISTDTVLYVDHTNSYGGIFMKMLQIMKSVLTYEEIYRIAELFLTSSYYKITPALLIASTKTKNENDHKHKTRMMGQFKSSLISLPNTINEIKIVM